MIHVIFVASIKVHKILLQVNWELGNAGSTKKNTSSQSTPVDRTSALASWALPLGHPQSSRSHL